LVLALNEYRQELATLEDMRGLGGPSDGLEQRVAATKRQISKAIDSSTTLGFADIRKRRINDTELLREVLDRITTANQIRRRGRRRSWSTGGYAAAPPTDSCGPRCCGPRSSSPSMASPTPESPLVDSMPSRPSQQQPTA
jgi:hypothetical protein